MRGLATLPYRLREGKSAEAAKGWACSSPELVRQSHPRPLPLAGGEK